MYKALFPLLRSFIAVAALLLSSPAFAEDISKQEAVSIAQQVYPGRVLAVKRNGAVYRVKTLSDSGEVRIIVIDATSGKVISGP